MFRGAGLQVAGVAARRPAHRRSTRSRILERVLFDLFLVLVLSIHLLAANVAAAAPLVCLALDVRDTRGDHLAGDVGRWLLRMSLAGLAVALALGGGALAILWLSDWER